MAALSAADRTDEAKQTLASIAAQCAQRGMVRYLLDGGPRVVALLEELRDDLFGGRWRPTWTAIPPAFLDSVVGEAQNISRGVAAQHAGPTLPLPNESTAFPRIFHTGPRQWSHD